MIMKMKLAAVAMVAVALLWSLPAHASTVSIALGTTGNVVATSPTGNAAIIGMSFGSFIVNNVDVTGNPPLINPQLLGSSSFNVSSGAAGTLDVFVTSVDNFNPLGPAFQSTLTTNVLTDGWTVEEKTWIGPDNTAFGMGTLIGDHTFTGIDTSKQIGFATPLNPYSITAEYIITSTGGGSANSTIDVFSAPEPSSLLLLGTGLLGLGFSLRRKHI